jgi:site-specific recombinase XerD
VAAVQNAYEAQMLIVRGKGDKERMVPLSPPALKAYKKVYMNVKEQFVKGSPLAFSVSFSTRLFNSATLGPAY